MTSSMSRRTGPPAPSYRADNADKNSVGRRALASSSVGLVTRPAPLISDEVRSLSHDRPDPPRPDRPRGDHAPPLSTPAGGVRVDPAVPFSGFVSSHAYRSVSKRIARASTIRSRPTSPSPKPTIS